MLWSAVLLALRELRRNALRSSLTILGVVIGVAAVITMVTLGEGVTAQVRADIAELGSNLLVVSPGQAMRPGGARATAAAFDLADADAIAREVPDLAALAPMASHRVTAVQGSESWSTTAQGTDNAFLEVRQWTLALGRPFSDAEARSGQAVCILGETVREKLFGAADPIGSQVRLGKMSCRVIGVLAPKGQASFGFDQDDVVLVPLRACQRRLAGNRDVGGIYVSVRSGASTEDARAAIERVLRARRRIGPDEDDDFHVRDMKEIADTLAGTTRVLTALLGAVAAVSLLVGGIGIMNIMLVSVTERTGEIGIRLAIGALEREVLMQFLVEAVVLSSLGGAAGILAGLAAALSGARALGVPFVVDPGVVALAVLFSAGVGVAFGFFPARRAARLDPIEALRHE